MNFATAMPDANYSYVSAGNKNSGGAVCCVVGIDTVAPTTSALRIQTLTSSTIVVADWNYVNVAVFSN